jgi:ubiquinone/menaquinone biosynthesis C-methylase UbiE
MTRMLPSNATATREEAFGTYHRTDGPVNVAPDTQLRHCHAGGTNQRPAFRGASAASNEMTREYYPFRSSEDERQRLIAQGELVAPLTQRLFEKAGITSGMRVLDIGSGSGDVAFLAARFVGSSGSVIGADRDPAQVAFAAQRAKAAGLTNVRFMTGDFREIELSPAVDAIVGRLVLMYVPDPLDALRRALRNLRAGGVIALQESIIDYDGPVLIEPLNCLAAKTVEWFRAGFKHAGVHPRMGMRLFGLMRAAGLDPSTEIGMMAPIQQGPDGPLFGILTSVVRSQIPAIVASGVATEAEIDIETLEERLIADAPANGVVGYFNSGHVGVWAVKP